MTSRLTSFLRSSGKIGRLRPPDMRKRLDVRNGVRERKTTKKRVFGIKSVQKFERVTKIVLID